MKVNGVQITPPSDQVLVLERDEANIVFIARAVPDWEEFKKLCPEPTPPVVQTKNGTEPDYKDAGYKSALEEHNKRLNAWLIIRSLAPSNIEWEKVDPQDPGTWTKWQEELTESGLTQYEAGRVVQLVTEANTLSEEKIKQARDNYFRQSRLKA